MLNECVLCRWIGRPGILIGLGALLLLLLGLGGRWLWLVFLLYLGLIVVVGLVALAFVARRVIVRLCWKAQADPKGAGSQGHPKSGPVYVPPTIYKRPDPLIYSQPWLLARGLAVTWDNPDIRVFVAGPPPVPASPHALGAGVPHLIRARVWNGSLEAPAVNLLVRFWYLNFGIGTLRNFIGETLIDLPVKGAAGLPSVAEMPWTTPAIPGHYCLQVELVWGDDADQGNNLGQTNLDIKKLNSPNASFTFLLRNDGVHPAQLRLTSDAYQLPPLPACEPLAPGRRPPDRAGRHLPAAHALPLGWQVMIDDAAAAPLAPGEERPVTVKIVAVDGFAGELDVNVNAFDGRRLVGGVTLRVHS